MMKRLFMRTVFLYEKNIDFCVKRDYYLKKEERRDNCMKLNGHEIEKLQESLDNSLISPFDISHLGVVSYDLSIDSFYQGGKKVEKDSIQL